MAFKLMVGNSPNQDLAKTNCVYVYPEDSVAKCTEVEIGFCAFTVRPHPEIQRGSIGLNSIQRMVLRVSSGDVVEAAPLDASNIPNCVLLTLEVTPLRKLGVQMELDSQDLSGRMVQIFTGQIFTLDQQMVFEFQGTNFRLKVNALLAVNRAGDQLSINRARLEPRTSFVFDTAAGMGIKVTGQRSIAAPALFKTKEFNFEKLGIGGLDQQFDQIFRRAFASRVFPPAVVERLGIHHVKGVLLYGPPGTGKTLIARQIGKMLNGKEPKVVNGPEVLSKFVGESEENVRKLFGDAEADYRANGESADLHVIIFDEIDAICKQRGSVRDGSGVHDTLVNQLLTKIDGVDALNNILLIGMTNRKDMIDEALLRPGRLEVHIEIGLPDEKGRLQILKIHTNKMEQNSFKGVDVDLWDLAVRTKNFSGAELEGLVKSAVSFALNRAVDVNDLSRPIDEDNLKVTMADFQAALEEIKPAFGAQQDALGAYRSGGIIDYGDHFRHVHSTIRTLVEQVRSSAQTNLLSCLLEGPPGAGKTALAATVGIDSEFPFVKVLSAENMVGYSEQAKCSNIAKVFDDAYKSPLSIVVLDDIERLLEYVAIGPRFSNAILQAILVLLKKQPPLGRKLLIVGTTSLAGVMEDMDVAKTFNVVLRLNNLREPDIRAVLVQQAAFAPSEVDMAVASLLEAEMPIKRLLLLLDMARQGLPDPAHPVPIMRWTQIIRDLTM